MKIKQYLSALLLTLTLACSNQEAIYGEPPKQVEVIPSHSAFKLSTKGNIDGTRINHLSITGTDGSETFVGNYDTALDTFCEWKMYQDLSPKYFCYPLSGGGLAYSDDKCTLRVMLPSWFIKTPDGKPQFSYTRTYQTDHHIAEKFDSTATIGNYYTKDDRASYFPCLLQGNDSLHPLIKTYSITDLVGAM